MYLNEETGKLGLAMDSGSKVESDSSSAGSDSDWADYETTQPEEEPEWDVDSFDGRELKIYPGVRKMYTTQENYDEYYQERLRAFHSKGFIADPLSGIYETRLDETNRDLVTRLANVCVQKFNDTHQMNLELVNVVRANDSGLAHWKLYITFMAREYQGGPLVEYQAKVIKYARHDPPPCPILCRPTPKTGP